jgi:thiol-disulfide isomerase/thioredoxin
MSPPDGTARAGGLRRRLLALAGLVVIVGAAVGVLLAIGVIGNQGGGKGIEKVLILEPPRTAAQAGLEVGPQVGKLAPDFEISDFDGSRRRLSDFRGKPVYVNFWATSCIACLAELPDIQKLQSNHSDELAVITVNRREPLDRARSFFRTLPREDGGEGVSFTVNGMDIDGTLYQEYKGLGLPVSVFIDANGVVTKVFNGQLRLSDMEEALAQALAGA